MAQDFSKIKLGACKVTYDVGGTTPVVIESTEGGVELLVKIDTFEVKTDQTGDTPVKEIIKAVQASANVPISEYDLTTISKMIPGSRLVTDATDTTKKKVVVSGQAGADLLAYAKKVKFQPLNGTEADAITFLLAAPKPDIKYSFQNDKTRVTNVSFVAYPDPTANNDLMEFGDDSAVAA